MLDQIGSLEVGKKADLVIINAYQPHWVPLIDPVANLVHGGLGTDVSQVWVDGMPMVVDGRVQSIDQDEVLREAQTSALALWVKMH